MPSLQSTGVPASQVPAPSQVSSPLQNSPSGQGLPAGSNWQLALQQSLSRMFPSSHSSPGSTMPSPQPPSGSQVSVASLQTVADSHYQGPVLVSQS